jgi:peptidoglycan/LPS O-acetylase OafA/YrhL
LQDPEILLKVPLKLQSLYLPQLDGLRGLAILGVLVFHTGRFSLGWTGIVLFFVLSGFLITGILLDGKQRPAYFRNFYARRALRIFPAYYLVLGLTWWIKRDFTVSALEAGLGSSVPEWTYFLVYAQNYWMAAHWFGTPLSRLLGFSWTLAVEEQFYLVWPLLVYFLGARALLLLCAVLVAAAPLLRMWILWASDNPMLTLASLPSHLDSLAIGAAICLMWRDAHLRDWLNRRVGATLFVAAGIPLALLVGGTGFAPYALTSRLQWMRLPGNEWFLTLISLVFGAVLILALSGPRRLTSAMAWRPLRALGKISYGAYLYFTLAYFLVATAYRVSVSFPLPGTPIGDWDLLAINAVQMVLTVAMAAASYRYLERPLLTLKERFR